MYGNSRGQGNHTIGWFIQSRAPKTTSGEQHDFDRNYLVGICQKWEVGKCQKTVVGKCPRKPSLLENVRNFFVGK